MEAPIFALDFAAANVNLGSSYLLVGTDSYLVDKVIETIKKKLKKKENIDTFIIYGDDVKSSELADILDTYTIFSSAKLVILKNAEQLNKYELKTLSSYFSSPSEIQSLAIATEKIDLHNESWKQIKAHSTIINCESPRYGGAIRSWLDKSLKDMNKTMTIKAIEEFINRIELDYYYAANELNKLDLLTTGRNRITEEDVMKSLGTTRTGTLIDFYRALGKKQEKQAIEALEKMLNANWEFLQIFFQFTKFYNNIWHILLLKKAHISDNEIVSKHLSDIYPNQRKEFLELSRSYNLASLEKIFTILLETDQQFKLSVADSQILLITCLIRVMEA
ncbi:MAG TPA: DNA polymerase III subunit delta [Candidatus Cloacimonas sp.]|jgi:DNA polymerase-3 subunit delta|nr:DNA polymerase III subunit delta [Candidatus Cloacimonadota bacterium]HNV92572.1 DNA polymerase III subunit delta [Candidatus Cloacimonas sp.]MDD3733780.1 DNA polymerase III subunit delta [Candidatus Cloacimonadota bacterium]MDD4677270.1 DNA polymerase III subunit delta [Candidatus Cloacimonadota bacterium]HNZ32921.1 DNA polymerase III subunit delta [Candidatus Cloacimonas sp.]